MTASPGYARQSRYRVLFRIAAVVLLGLAATLFVVAGVDFFGSDGEPEKFWMFFVAIPTLFVGGVCSQAGFGGAAARYAAGETMPVVRDSASYLTDGQGLLGAGRTVDDDGGSPASARTGPYCSSCGQRNDVEARFCDACGVAIRPS